MHYVLHHIVKYVEPVVLR